MSYVPHSERERSEMLAAIGAARTGDLFADVPAHVRFPALNLPPPASELEILRDMQTLANRNVAVDPALSFLGAGTSANRLPSPPDMNSMLNLAGSRPIRSRIFLQI